MRSPCCGDPIGRRAHGPFAHFRLPSRPFRRRDARRRADRGCVLCSPAVAQPIPGHFREGAFTSAYLSPPTRCSLSKEPRRRSSSAAACLRSCCFRNWSCLAWRSLSRRTWLVGSLPGLRRPRELRPRGDANSDHLPLFALRDVSDAAILDAERAWLFRRRCFRPGAAEPFHHPVSVRFPRLLQRRGRGKLGRDGFRTGAAPAACGVFLALWAVGSSDLASLGRRRESLFCGPRAGRDRICGTAGRDLGGHDLGLAAAAWVGLVDLLRRSALPAPPWDHWRRSRHRAAAGNESPYLWRRCRRRFRRSKSPDRPDLLVVGYRSSPCRFWSCPDRVSRAFLRGAFDPEAASRAASVLGFMRLDWPRWCSYGRMSPAFSGGRHAQADAVFFSRDLRSTSS